MPLSKRNRRGLIWLLVISGTIAISPRVLSGLLSVQSPVITSEEAVQIHNEYEAKEKNKPVYVKKKRPSKFVRPVESFDPNLYSKNDWKKLGLSERQSEVVVNFAKRGLYSNDDVKKIFVIPSELYELIKDSLYYPKRESGVKNDQWKKKEKRVISVDLNAANQSDLESIPGIGPYFASKIIEHRIKLGGFIGKEQLLEVWNFDEEKYERIKEFIVLNNSEISKININTATWEELRNHPYISSQVANSIVKMREQPPGYKEIDDIKRSKLIDEELFHKLKPYLTL